MDFALLDTVEWLTPSQIADDIKANHKQSVDPVSPIYKRGGK
jgi:hypothetical protein